MATTKNGNKKKPVMLSEHVQQVASAVHAGVANALKKDPCDDTTEMRMMSSTIGPPVNPKTVYVTVTWVIDLS